MNDSIPPSANHEDLVQQATEAEALLAAGRYVEAHAALLAVIAGFRSRLERAPDDVGLSVHIGGQLNNLATCLLRLNNVPDAIQVAEGAAEIFRGLVQNDARWLPWLATTLSDLTRILIDAADPRRALKTTSELLMVRRALNAHDLPAENRRQAQQQLTVALRTFAVVRAATGIELDDAYKAIDEAIVHHMSILSAEPTEENVNETYVTERVQVALLTRMGRVEEARRVQEALDAQHLEILLTARPQLR